MPVAVVRYQWRIQPGQQIGRVREWQHERHHPDGQPDNKAGDQAAAIALGPVNHAQGAGQQLQSAGEGNGAENGQVEVFADNFMKQQRQENDHGDEQALDPLQPPVDIALVFRGFQGQHHVVQRHARQCQGADDHQAAGR